MQDNNADMNQQDTLDEIKLEPGAWNRWRGRQTSGNFRGRTLANSVSTIVGWLIPSIILFGLTSFLVRGIGEDAYGVFTLTSVLTGYFTLMNLGFGQAVTKHTAHYAAVDDIENLRLVVSAGMLIFPAIGLVGCIFHYVLAPWLAVSVFNIGPSLQNEAIVAIQLSGVGFFLMMFTSLLEGLTMGMNRFDIPNLVRILRVSLSSGLMVVGVLIGRGLVGVMAGNIIGFAIAAVVNTILTFRLVPGPKFRGAIRKVRELFNFGKFVFVTQTVSTVVNQVGPTVLGIVATMSSVTQFALPTRVILTGLEVFQRLFQLLFPMSAALASQQKKERLNQIFVTLMRWQLFLFIPFTILIIFQGKWLLGIWVGPKFVADGYTILLITVVYQIFSLLTSVPSQFSFGLGHPEYNARFSIIRLVIMLTCIYPLARYHGAVGVAEAYLISSLQGLVFIGLVARRLLGLNLWHEFGTEILKLAGILAGFLILYVFFGAKIESYGSILVQVAVSLGLLTLYLSCTIILGILPVSQGKKLLQREFWKTI